METSPRRPHKGSNLTSFSNLFPARGWKHFEFWEIWADTLRLSTFSNLFPARGWKHFELPLDGYSCASLLSQTFSPQGDGNFLCLSSFRFVTDLRLLSQTFSPQGDGNFTPVFRTSLTRFSASSNLFPARGWKLLIRSGILRRFVLCFLKPFPRKGMETRYWYPQIVLHHHFLKPFPRKGMET